MKVLLILSVCIAATLAQYEGPPRLNIPGAYQLPQQRPANIQRQARIQTAPAAVHRIRKPIYHQSRPSFKSVDTAPRPNFQLFEDQAKPVTEEPEDELQEINTPSSIFTPSAASYTTQETQNDFFDFISTTSQPKTPPPTNYIHFQPSPTPAKHEAPRPPPPTNYIHYQPNPTPAKQEAPRPAQFRPNPSFLQVIQPVRNEPTQRPQPARVQPLSYRPQRPSRPEQRPYDEEEDEPIQPIRQQYTRPVEQKPLKPLKSSGLREKKPVAQILRKYREENPDGSITWGYENDDGSFKEETMGVDCVTRGKYGYVDPDGVKREYTYETGNPCDKNRDQEDEDEKGFIDYQENKAVLPNGVTIDLANMGKKSKRPFRSPINH